MGYLDNSSITIDAILTKKGKEALASGQGNFNITQFALSDDEIDYTLWNPADSRGSAYYGAVIENLPLIEATPNEQNIMRSKLVTLPKNTPRIPVITVGNTSIVLQSNSQGETITPSTINFDKGNATLGYTAILSNSLIADLQVFSPAPGGVAGLLNGTAVPTDTAVSITQVGLTFKVIPKVQYTGDATATLTIVGNETGGRVTIQITVKQVQTANYGQSFPNGTP